MLFSRSGKPPVRFGHGECLPSSGTYGNISRNSFRGPKALQFDAQISRIFPIHESLSTTLRLEAFNVLNHPDFSNSRRKAARSTFGQRCGQTSSGPTTSIDARVFQGSIKINF